ncbi:EFR1 family ferrodoxin [Candidatus Enterococcus murrayae]|uniref:EFR1 family ferrodoxin n=1 Tax=Candidatus Enterococcus murrayae TaxID=2815321 RepID=A0ABS3HMD8_9ENTE|nr:EFR1 family ferrodoxin [Enterococcus sp. MJM16]MBO0454609.1 EFR1 family ferrodoxin [Enterococcus sp. MJM16]
MKNMIFYFSGTGNSLHAARKIGKSLTACSIQSMTSIVSPQLQGHYESIGFIYPTYFQGVPIAVETFIQKLDFSSVECDYFYGLTTYGALQGNALPQLDHLLRGKGEKLHYGGAIKMYSNYVVMYELSKKVRQKTEKAEQAIDRVIVDLTEKKVRAARRPVPFLDYYYRWRVEQAKTLDQHYQVSDDCISCNLCQKVCPVNNIEMVEGQPTFLNHCEQCVACVQYCPKKAINFKSKTQQRRRYNHPEISSKTLIRHNRKIVDTYH